MTTKDKSDIIDFPIIEEGGQRATARPVWGEEMRDVPDLDWNA
ncbi:MULTISPECIES: hypothetical protein [unclassified Agreia]|nr:MULTISPECIES: hypothetical protein [unclassified Agreia]